MGDQSLAETKKPMQSIVLQPFPSITPPSGLTREQKLAFVAYNLEQHEQNMKDKIRERGLCEKEYADPEAAGNPLIQQSRQEPGPNALHAGIRSAWKRHGPKPVVKTSRRLQPTFNLQPKNNHVGVAKRTLARLDDYGQHLQPTLNAVYQAKDGRSASSSGGAPMPVISGPADAGREPSGGNHGPSRDPRLRR